MKRLRTLDILIPLFCLAAFGAALAADLTDILKTRPLAAPASENDRYVIVQGGAIKQMNPFDAPTPTIGPWGADVARFSSLSTAKMAASTAGKTLVVTGTVDVAALTIPADRALEVKPGGKIRYSGHLHIDGPFSAGKHLAFEAIGSGYVTFGSGAVVEAYPEWFEINASDHQAVAKVIRACNHMQPIRFSGRVYHCATAINVDKPVWLEGVGAGDLMGTELNFAAMTDAVDSAAITLDNSVAKKTNASVVKGMRIVGNPISPLVNAQGLKVTGTGTTYQTFLTLENLLLMGFKDGLYVTRTYMSTMKDIISAYNNRFGFLLSGISTTMPITRCWSHDNYGRIDDGDTSPITSISAGWVVIGSHYNTFQNCAADNNGDFADLDSMTYGWYFGYGFNTAVIGSGAENNTGPAIITKYAQVSVDSFTALANARHVKDWDETRGSFLEMFNNSNVTLTNCNELSVSGEFMKNAHAPGELMRSVINLDGTGSELHTFGNRFLFGLAKGSKNIVYGSRQRYREGPTPTYAAAQTFTVAGNHETDLAPGTRVRMMTKRDTSGALGATLVKIFSTTTFANYSGGVTTVNINDTLLPTTEALEIGDTDNYITYTGSTLHRKSVGTGPPTLGAEASQPWFEDANLWLQGDIRHNSQPQPGEWAGWECIANGRPGTWRGFGWIPKKDSYANRPTGLGAGDAGAYFLDTDADPAGAWAFWNDTTWEYLVKQSVFDQYTGHQSRTDNPHQVTAEQVGAARVAAEEVYAIDYNGGALTHVSINQAITAIGSNVKRLVITPGTWTMTNNVTVPSNITLVIKPGVLIDWTVGVLTINGPLEAPRRQWLQDFTYNNLVFGPYVKDIYTDWIDAAGDGVTDDYRALRAILYSGDNKHIWFTKDKTYNLASTLYSVKTGLKLHGQGATLKSAVANGQALGVGGPFQNYTGKSIAMTKNSNTFTIPAGVTVAAGDMISITASAEYVPGYKYGVLTNVTNVSGNTATIDILPVYDFTGATLVRYYPADGYEIEGFTIDNSGSTNNTSGILLIGRNSYIHDNRIKGSDAAALGINVLGINSRIENNIVQDYLGIVTTGGRYGDCIGVAGHNISIVGNTLSNAKHAVTISARDYITNNVRVASNTATQDPSQFGATVTVDGQLRYRYSGVIDVHGDAENILVENNQFDGAGFALATIRNGNSVFKGNRIRYWNTSASGVGIFNIGETTLQSLVLDGNDIEAATASTPLMSAADGSYLQSIAVASPVYASGIDVNVRHINNTLTNISNTTSWPTLAGTTPSTPCQNGQLWVDTNATSGQQVYACESGSWVLQAGSGSPSGTVTAETSFGAASNAGAASTYSRGDHTHGTPANPLTGTTVSIAPTSTTSTSPAVVTVPVSDLSTAAPYAGVQVSLTNSTASPNASASIRGQNNQIYYSGTGTLDQLSGVWTSARNTGAGTTNTINAFAAETRATGGTVGIMSGYLVESPVISGATVSGSIRGVRIKNQGNAAASTSYGLYIESQSGSTNSYGLITGAGLNSFGDVVQLQNASAPAATTDSSRLYSADIGGAAGKAGLHVKSEDGSVTAIGAGIALNNVTAPAAITDYVRVYNVEGDYLHILDEDGNDHTIGQNTLSLGAASGGNGTVQTTSHVTKGTMTIPQAISQTGGTGSTFSTTGYVYQQGTFASIYVQGGSTAQSIPNGATHTQLTGFTTDGLERNLNADAANDRIVLVHDGVYKVDFTISFSGTANSTWHMALYVGGNEQSQCHTERKLNASGDTGSAAFTCIVTTSGVANFDIRAAHDQVGSVNITPVHMNLVMTYLGEL